MTIRSRPASFAPRAAALLLAGVLAGVLTGAAIPPAVAAPAPPAVRAEIEALLGRLQASGCHFERNGSWYDAAKARSHLLTKLSYIESHGTLTSTEQFIDLAASRSSMSGEPYHVACGGGAPVDSGAWLAGQLRAMRAAAGASAPR